jgi:uncharacterized RDD family membrane protein YckC
MNCLYCRAPNSDDEHRCKRCGRRLHYTPAPIGAVPQYSHTALAEERAPRIHSQASAVPQAPELVPGSGTGSRRVPSYQRTLFGTKDMGSVLPFNAFVSGGNAAGGNSVRGNGSSDRPLAPRATRPRGRRPVSTNQQTLNFTSQAMTSAAAPKPEGVIYCTARVASLPHRVLAAVVDFALVAVALGLFVAPVYGFGAEVLFDRQTTLVYIAVAAITVLLYRLLWCLGNGDSPGMRALQLRLVDLDGHRPDRRKRFLRLFSGCLSILAAGLGLLWAVADEESLTWHDHISRTFPTLRG